MKKANKIEVYFEKKASAKDWHSCTKCGVSSHKIDKWYFVVIGNFHIYFCSKCFKKFLKKGIHTKKQNIIKIKPISSSASLPE